MSSPTPAPDNSVAIEQMQEAAAANAKTQATTDAATAAANLAALRTSGANSATNQTNQYFQSLGLDPTKYSGDINSQIQNILSGIDPNDPNPGSSFQNADQNIYQNLTKAYQTKEQGALSNEYSPSYASTALPFSMDAPYVASTVGDQRASADAIIQNMLKRGVLTATGAAGSEADLDRQQPAINQQVQQLADSVISGGQQNLNTIINQGQTDAGTLKLGQAFDPSTYSTQVNDSFNQFVNSLSDQIKAKTPGNLFQTNGLAAIGGAAQGAGNTAYNPTAAAGIAQDPANTTDATDPNSTKESVF